ncbi:MULTISPECIES: DUF2142 domain-containing protein [unclassified Cryobacterium]|uniref:DUF2142 domain-containing protein n=1 Tax=unclassified Cryobacterium TaxID=2649013 RepID=UPI001446ABCD|nr:MULTISPECIES: DUF2142 domain-containing protein [unclassified Cryobacterium]
MTTLDALPRPRSFGAFLRSIRLIHLAPVLALVALSAWAFASPIGAGPDDDYHLVSVWCANGGSAECTPGAEWNNRTVTQALPGVACYAQDASRSAGCQNEVWSTLMEQRALSERGNFVGEYPHVYYSSMRILAGGDIQTSALVMRLINAALFVGLATALAWLLPAQRRRTLLWGWVVVLVPLGMFLIPSNNPSGWAITGVGTAFLALLGWFETHGRRRWALGALYLVGVLMAAGARGDAAVYAAGATVTVLILTAARQRQWALHAILPLAGFIIAVLFFSTSGQAGVFAAGFSGGGGATIPISSDQTGVEAPLAGFGLAAYNLLMLPFLWTGVWGSWSLGWLDTQLPAIVQWAATAAFVVFGFAGIGLLTWRKAIATGGVLFVLIALPVHVLTAGGDKVGANLQPRYLLPLIVLLVFLLVFEPAGARLRFTRVQTFVILGAVALANLVSLQVNIRRYVTGADQQGLNLDSGAEWWWAGFPVGPTAVWVVGSLAYAGLLAVLWPQLSRVTPVLPEPLESSLVHGRFNRWAL